MPFLYGAATETTDVLSPVTALPGAPKADGAAAATHIASSLALLVAATSFFLFLF